jgi:hypothetical protein
MRRVAASLAFVASIVVACGRPQHPSNPALVDRMFDGTCGRAAGCGADAQKSAACQKECRGKGPVLSKLRPDYVDALVRCVDATSCDVVLDRPALREKCARGLRVEPSAKARRFCELASERDRKCAGKDYPMERCLRMVIFADDVLGDATECMDRPCSNYAGCLGEVIGIEDVM